MTNPRDDFLIGIKNAMIGISVWKELEMEWEDFVLKCEEEGLVYNPEKRTYTNKKGEPIQNYRAWGKGVATHIRANILEELRKEREKYGTLKVRFDDEQEKPIEQAIETERKEHVGISIVSKQIYSEGFEQFFGKLLELERESLGIVASQEAFLYSFANNDIAYSGLFEWLRREPLNLERPRGLKCRLVWAMSKYYSRESGTLGLGEAERNLVFWAEITDGTWVLPSRKEMREAARQSAIFDTWEPEETSIRRNSPVTIRSFDENGNEIIAVQDSYKRKRGTSYGKIIQALEQEFGSLSEYDINRALTNEKKWREMMAEREVKEAQLRNETKEFFKHSYSDRTLEALQSKWMSFYQETGFTALVGSLYHLIKRFKR